MTVELTRRDEFAVITLNRPEALNALSFDIVGQIGNAIAAAQECRDKKGRKSLDNDAFWGFFSPMEKGNWGCRLHFSRTIPIAVSRNRI